MPDIKKISYVKSTKEGRLYIPTSDFFKQDRVKVLIEKLIESSIYKDIENQKENKELETV